MNKEEKIHWSQLPCNPLTTQLDPRMLLPEGFYRYQYLALIKRSNRQHYKVLYDKDFVIHKIKEVVLKPLGVDNLHGLIGLLKTFGVQEAEPETQVRIAGCRVYKLHGDAVVKISDLEAQGIKINAIKTNVAQPKFKPQFVHNNVRQKVSR